MTRDKSTAVVISAHRIYPTLELCLDGFSKTVEKPEDLIFVNNGGPEELKKFMDSRYPRISRIDLAENRFFCGGYNAGVRMAMDRGYEFVLIANADTEVVNSNFIGELEDAARRWPKAAFLGPLVYYRKRGNIQQTCLRFPSVARHAAIWLPWRLFPGVRSPRRMREEEVEFLNGVCVLCRCNALRTFGLMDERFGGYIEDADWSWRARRAGWRSVFISAPSVIHHEEPTGYEHFSLKSFMLKRNTVLWLIKIGCRRSASIYARTSTMLAWLRMQLAPGGHEKKAYRYFLRRLRRTYSGLLLDEQPGPWFGPPHGSWDNGPHVSD